MEISKITNKGQITVPKTVRDDLGLSDGDKIVFIKNGKGYVIVKEKDIETGDYFIDANNAAKN